MKSLLALVMFSLGFVIPCSSVRGLESGASTLRLKLGLAQIALAPGIEENRDRIVRGIGEAAERGVRVVVFPEGALRGHGGERPELVESCINTIRETTRTHNLYVLFGGASYSAKLKRDVYWLYALSPDGKDLFQYDKLYDVHDAKMPGVFLIDGIPCTAMLCADRWLRGVAEIPIQQGAQISFELSCNYACEWVEPYDWYWYVPRALRNNVWVVFANTGNKLAGTEDAPGQLRHGHSAVIAPDGQIFASTRGDTETLVLAEIDPSLATRAEAKARATNPVLRPFWEAGLRLQGGQKETSKPVKSTKFKETDVTIAAAQTTGNLTAMEAAIAAARAKGADLIVFPERSTDAPSAIDRLSHAARENQMTVVFGMVRNEAGKRYNSAWVIGPDGTQLTRYDEIAAQSPYSPGTNPGAMWFAVKGVPAVVTIGHDALWTELSELAAVAGARIHVHLENDPSSGPGAELRRLQIWSNLASYLTFTATVNVTGSILWDDLRGMDESRAQVKGTPKPDSGPAEIYSEFSANLITRAASGQNLIFGTRRIQGPNPHHPKRTSSFNPQMEAWYGIGARIIRPETP